MNFFEKWFPVVGITAFSLTVIEGIYSLIHYFNEMNALSILKNGSMIFFYGCLVYFFFTMAIQNWKQKEVKPLEEKDLDNIFKELK